MSSINSFGSIRQWLFPIHRNELTRFLPMALMMLCVVFNYTILRNFKDSLIINAPGSDASVIAFLKMWGTTPFALLFMLLYTKGLDRWGRERMVYLVLTPFLLFFALFGGVLYPLRDTLHPCSDRMSWLQQTWPHLKGWIAVWGNWSYALFFVVAELCGNASLSLCFWQLANLICSREEANRFYPLFGLIGNLGLILAGLLTQHFTKPRLNTDPWAYALSWLLGLVCLGLIFVQIIYYRLSRTLERDPLLGARLATQPLRKQRSGLAESLRHVLTNPHLLQISLLVLGYSLTINYCDVLWKDQVKSYFSGNAAGYSGFMGHFSVTIGLFTIPLMLISSYLLRKISWFSAAVMTPLVMLIGGGGFFASMLWEFWQTGPFQLFGLELSPLTLAVYFGFWQNALSKASKYSLFDPSKEMAYIPLEEEVKVKGKAAVDLVGACLGKTGGSLTFFALQTLLPNLSLQQLSPWIALLFFSMLLLWFHALRQLDLTLQRDPSHEPS